MWVGVAANKQCRISAGCLVSHLAGSRMMASGLRSPPPPPAGASCQLAVCARGAAARPTNPGGGVCLKGVDPKLTVSSAFFRQIAGYSAWPCRYCRRDSRGQRNGRPRLASDHTVQSAVLVRRQASLKHGRPHKSAPCA